MTHLLPAAPRIGRRYQLRRLSALLAAPALASLGLPAQAQTSPVPGWPVRPVRFVVPAGAGGQTDLFARFIAEQLSKAFGQPFVVENKAGASGTIGAQAVAKATDGHSLLFSAASFTAVPQALNPQLPYDLLKDLVPIVQIGAGGQFVGVPASSPIRTLKELWETGRAQPGKLAYGTTGVASVTHIVMSALLRQQGVRMNHVPYKSGAEVLRDMLGGVLPVGWIDTTTGGQAAKAGRVRLLGVTGTYRMPGNPDVATLSEQGYPIDQNGWLGLFAPAGTPEAVLRAINAEVNRVMGSEDARQRLTSMNVATFPSNTPEQFAATVRSDVQAWRKIIVDNDIKPE